MNRTFNRTLNRIVIGVLSAIIILAPLAVRAQGAATPLTLLIEDALLQRDPMAARHEINFAGAPALDGALTLAGMDYQNRTGAFSAMVSVDGAAPVRVTGRAVAIVETPALARALPAGERIAASDIVFVEMEANRLPADALRDPAGLEGMEARRALRAGAPLRPYDIAAPAAVKKNEIITVYYIRPGITLAARGRALEDAPAGAPVRVLNLQSNRVIEATAEAPGRARVDSPRQYAATR